MEIFGDSDIGNIWRFGYRKYLESWILEMFGDSDIAEIWRFGYWRYLEIWILEIFGDLDIGDWILETGYWRFGFSRLDIGDMEIFGNWILMIWSIFETCSRIWRFGYPRFGDLAKTYIFLM